MKKSIRHTELSAAETLIRPHVSVFWFRRDLRIEDNAGLYHALKEGKSVLPLFIFDTCILEELDNPRDARVEFIHNAILLLQDSLTKLGSTLLVLIGNPVEIFKTINPHIDWRWGEAYFARQLLDYDLASNNGGWQWAAGTGCDASPYFRVFNPQLQTEKFDRDLKYIRRWIPELDDVGTYALPIVDHQFARDRAINVYKKALE